MEIDQTPGLPRDDNGALEGFDGAVGADSTLYAVWAAGNLYSVHHFARRRQNIREGKKRHS